MKPMILNIAGTVLALLLLVGVYVGLVAPAVRDADDALVQARIALETAEARKGDVVGPAYQRDLEEVRELSETHLRQVVQELKGRRAKLEAWFPRLVMRAEGLPAWDEFGSAYAFNQDRLREEVNARVREACRIDVKTIPLRIPLFQAQERDPRQEEMRQEQRRFNLERILLSSAARAGAFPVAAISIVEDWKSGESDSTFHTTRVRLQLRLVPEHFAPLLRSLLALSGEGPTVRLAGLDCRPSPVPERLGADDPLTIDATVDLDLVVYAGES